MMIRSRAWLAVGVLLIAVGLLLLMTSCTAFRPLPTSLTMPEVPAIVFYQADHAICLSPADADKLGRYLDKLSAFKHAWERLR